MLRARILSLVIRAAATIWNWTIGSRLINREIRDRLESSGESFIYAFWHGRIFLLLPQYKGSGILIPASESRDGEILAQVIIGSGLSVVRGSSKRKGERALLGMISGLRKGKIVGIAVDGPRGPAHQVKEGVIYLAGKLNKKIVPVASSAARYWILHKTWEKLLLPVPFTRGVVYYGEPITVNGTSQQELEAKRLELEASLIRLTQQADDHFSMQT